jgi:hypothetical protein
MGLGFDDLSCYRDQPSVSPPGDLPGPRRAPVHQALVCVAGAHPLDSAAGDAELFGLGLGALRHGQCLRVVPGPRCRARLRTWRDAGLDLHDVTLPVPRGGDGFLRQAVQQPERLNRGNRVTAGHREVRRGHQVRGQHHLLSAVLRTEPHRRAGEGEDLVQGRDAIRSV